MRTPQQMFATTVVLLALPIALCAQQVERFALAGDEVVVSNVAGTMHVERGDGDRVMVEVTRGGTDAAKLEMKTGAVNGRAALRVFYPEDHVVYPAMRSGREVSFSQNDDDTFDDDGSRQFEVRANGDGLDAHADIRILVPAGRTVFVRQGVGESSIENVEGNLDVRVAASPVRAWHVRGALRLSAGSGGVDVSDVSGERLTLATGSGTVRARGIDVRALTASAGSGGVHLNGVKTATLRLDTGSGGSEVELLSAPDDVNISTGSGGITLRLPASTSARVDVSAGSGGVETDFPVTVSSMQRRGLHGTIGDGKGSIRVSAGSGGVRMLRS